MTDPLLPPVFEFRHISDPNHFYHVYLSHNASAWVIGHDQSIARVPANGY
jgi:hypothetical protein